MSVLGGIGAGRLRMGRGRRDPRSGTIAGEMSSLTDEQLARYRERLEEARDTAIAVLGRTVDDVKPIEASGSAIGRVTRIDAIQMQGMAQMSRAQLELRLAKIRNALAALDAGTYGTCRYCKGRIDHSRLEALPEAPFCLPCQESFEA
jgi:DnaK suppressor protein